LRSRARRARAWLEWSGRRYGPGGRSCAGPVGLVEIWHLVRSLSRVDRDASRRPRSMEFV
jgi:hypothetical protein